MYCFGAEIGFFALSVSSCPSFFLGNSPVMDSSLSYWWTVIDRDYFLTCRYTSSLGNKRVELFDMGAGGSEPAAEDNVQMASGDTQSPPFYVSAT